MSMHDMEAFTEFAVCAVADSGLPLQEKRNLIHTLFTLEGYGDCGFTNCRTTRQMVDCAYTFLFDKEELWDYTERRAWYDEGQFKQGDVGMGGIYTYRDYDDHFPAANGKICVDSGSPAWEQMVGIGRITGDGAVPVEILPFADAMLTARYLLYHQYGGMDSYVKQGYYNTVFMSGIPEALPDDTPEDTFVTLTGFTRQQLAELDDEEPDSTDDEWPDDVPLGRAYRFCGELVTIVPMVEFDDGLVTLHGYRSQHPVKTGAGELSLRMTYRDGSMKGHFYQTGDDPGSYAWYADRKETLARLETFSRELESLLVPMRRLYPGWEELKDRYADMADDTAGAYDFDARISLLTSITELFVNTEAPDELTGQEGPYTLLLLELASYARAIGQFSRHEVVRNRAPQLAERAEGFVRAVKAKLDRHRNAVEGKRPALNPKVQARLDALKEELAQIQASETPDAAENARHVALLEALWQASLPLEERLAYCSQLYGFLAAAEEQVESHKEQVMKTYEAVPDMHRPLAAAEEYVATMPEGDAPLTLVLMRAENGTDYDVRTERL